MKDFTPTESVTCIKWSALVDNCLSDATDFTKAACKFVPAILAGCHGACKLTGQWWDAELVRAETGQEWMRLNFDPIDQADYPKLYAHLEAGIKTFYQAEPHYVN